MGSSPLLTYSSSIRTHDIVGVLFVLFAIIHILGTLVFYLDDDVLPEETKKINRLKLYFLVMYFLKSLLAGLYWIGLVKCVRWFIIFVIVVLVIDITLVFISVFVMLEPLRASSVGLLIAIAIQGYEKLVTVQLRK